MKFFYFFFVFPSFPQIWNFLDFIISSYIYRAAIKKKKNNAVLLFIQKDIWGHFDILHNIFLQLFFLVVYYSDITTAI